MVAAIIALVAAFHLLTIRPGHYWGDDFAQYILHARNIAEGLPYGDTGYIYNPANPFLAPRTYPPVYPLILAPIIRWSGMNLEAMKVATLLFLPAALLVIFLLFRRDLRFRHAAALIAMLGFSPFLWDFKDGIRSDLPFLFFLYLALLGARLAADPDISSRRKWAYIVMAGVATCLAFGSRTLGILLIPAFLFSDLVVHKKPTRVTVSITLMFILWMVIQARLGGRDASYLDQYAGWTPRVLLENALYAASLAYFWANGYSKLAAGLLCMVFCGLAGLGYLGRIRQRVTAFEVFLPLYVAVILSWPAMQGLRFFVPILPLLLFYSFAGLDRLRLAGRVRAERTVFGVLMTAVLVSFAADYTTLEFGSMAAGIHTRNSQEFFRFVSTNTAPDAVFVFVKPRALALCTGRRSAACHTPRNDSDLLYFFREISADYAVLGPVEDKPLTQLVEQHGDAFTPVYTNEDFTLYRINDQPPRK